MISLNNYITNIRNLLILSQFYSLDWHWSKYCKLNRAIQLKRRIAKCKYNSEKSFTYLVIGRISMWPQTPTTVIECLLRAMARVSWLSMSTPAKSFILSGILSRRCLRPEVLVTTSLIFGTLTILTKYNLSRKYS